MNLFQDLDDVLNYTICPIQEAKLAPHAESEETLGVHHLHDQQDCSTHDEYVSSTQPVSSEKSDGLT